MVLKHRLLNTDAGDENHEAADMWLIPSVRVKFKMRNETFNGMKDKYIERIHMTKTIDHEYEA